MRLRLCDVAWGSIGHVIFFRKRLRVVERGLAIQSLISFRCLYLGQIGCQGDGVSRQPGWVTQVIYDSCMGGSEIWWCMHSAHSLSSTLSRNVGQKKGFLRNFVLIAFSPTFLYNNYFLKNIFLSFSSLKPHTNACLHSSDGSQQRIQIDTVACIFLLILGPKDVFVHILFLESIQVLDFHSIKCCGRNMFNNICKPSILFTLLTIKIFQLHFSTSQQVWAWYKSYTHILPSHRIIL